MFLPKSKAAKALGAFAVLSAVTLLAVAAGYPRGKDEAERAGRAVMDRLAGGPGSWKCETVTYDGTEDRLIFGGFQKSVGIEDLINESFLFRQPETEPIAVLAESVTLTGLGSADVLEGALAPDLWSGDADVAVADSIVFEGIRSSGAAFEKTDGPLLTAAARRMSLEGVRLAKAGPDTVTGQAGYLKHLALSRLRLEGMSLELSDGSGRLFLNSYEALDVAFGAAPASAPADGPGAAPSAGTPNASVSPAPAGTSAPVGTSAPAGTSASAGPAPPAGSGPNSLSGDLTDVLLGQTASSDRATGFTGIFSVPGWADLTVSVAEVTGRDIRGAASVGDYELSGFRMQLKEFSEGIDVETSLGSFAARGTDATGLLRRSLQAVADYVRTGDDSHLKPLYTLANFVTLPYSLDSYSLRDFSLRTGTAEAGFGALSWEGPAEEGKIFDSRGSVKGLFLKAPWSDAPKWLEDLAEIAELLMIPEFRLDMSFTKTRDPRTGLTLWAVENLDARDLFGLRLSVSVTGLDQALADRLSTLSSKDAGDPAKILELAASEEVKGLGINGISLSYTDDSFAYRLASSFAANSVSMRDVADELEGGAERLATEFGREVNPAFIRVMRGILAKPGPFTLEWRPEQPVTVGLTSATALEPDTSQYAGLARLFLSSAGGPETPLFD